MQTILILLGGSHIQSFNLVEQSVQECDGLAGHLWVSNICSEQVSIMPTCFDSM